MDYQSFQPNPPTPQVSQQTPPVNKNFTPKFIWVIVALLVLGGTAYGGLWFWNDKNTEVAAPTFTPRVIDETAGWQTYRNEEYGFEFRYPEELFDKSINTTMNGFQAQSNAHGIHLFTGLSKYGFLGVSIIEKEFNSNDIQGIYGKIENPAILNIGGKVAYKWSDGDAGCGGSFIQLALNQKILQIQHGSCEEDHEPRLDKSQISNQILSTFKFIEPTVCIQVITPARNPQTGEVKNFPTPCDVPEGWEKI